MHMKSAHFNTQHTLTFIQFILRPYVIVYVFVSAIIVCVYVATHTYRINLNRCSAFLFHLLCISRLLYQRLELCYNVCTNCWSLQSHLKTHTYTYVMNKHANICACVYVCVHVIACVCIHIVYAITPRCCCWQLVLHCFRKRPAAIFSTTAAYLQHI